MNDLKFDLSAYSTNFLYDLMSAIAHEVTRRDAEIKVHFICSGCSQSVPSVDAFCLGGDEDEGLYACRSCFENNKQVRDAFNRNFFCFVMDDGHAEYLEED